MTWLSGYGSLVIVDHGNGFRTVYANLATVSVKSGSSVQSGTVVGSSGENIDGKLVHFEVWYGRERQNPLTYLR
ncbi:MAG: M23 family metallopeptidase [Ignavibacteria bacterium]|nr:M23 family metallopeptidase [Ignavibacteria bacterium]